MGKVLKNSDVQILKAQNRWALFNGTTSYIQYADDDRFSFTDGVNDLPFEIEFDLNVKAFYAVWVFIVSKYTEITGLREWFIGMNSNNIYIRCFQAGATTYIGRYFPLVINTSYKVKFTYDGSKSVSGIKCFLNNIETASTAQGTTITGMENSSSPMVIGKVGTYSVIDGYLRNLKITKNNQLVFLAPLQDSNAVSKDVIGGLSGTVTDVTVVNFIEREKWASFNKVTGANSTALIGTTSTLGWMNSGTFNMQFDIIPMTLANDTKPLYCASNPPNYGWMFYIVSNTLRLYWLNGTGSYAATIIPSTNTVVGTSYHITVTGNGTQLQVVYWNNNTNSLYYDSGLVSCSYVPNATTTLELRFGMVSSLDRSFQIRNFKIFTDTAGTVPFMSLPMQNAEDLMTDRVTGLQGNATAVSIINKNENVLRSKDLWSKFIGTIGNATIGVTSTLGWMNSGIFNLSFEINIPVTPDGKYLLHTAQATSHRGFWFYTWTNLIQLYWSNGSTNLINGISIIDGYVAGNSYKINFRGDGTKYYYTTYNPDGTINKTNEPTGTSITYVPYATTSYPLSFRRTGTAEIECYARNIKIYKSTDTSIPFMYLPLQDGGNIAKDVWGGLQGTVTNVKVIEI